ncbi:MFS transporter [Actinoplanes sp. OR16]|uniref:MFS transporter n=1 Tax=Actinoplanes sp. OR16 TaxID=946334 RepID=UPI000F6DD1BF|nr:MFS transporter [Actinoplanes sp. OR16]BBH67586.1 MFS transporter [Actinoplanes sp. OR16]
MNTFRALRSVPFRWYFAGQVASASGTFLQQTAVGWLVLQLTGSASALGLVLAAGGLPALLLGPWGGGVADRFDLRRLLIVTQAIYAVLAASIWALAATGHAGVPLVVVVSVLGGVVGIVDSPARQAFVGSLVPPDDLASAVSLNGVVMNSARVVGPALAGILIVAVGVIPCFLVNAISYLAVIAALLVIRPLSAARHSARSGGVADAIRYARGREQVLVPLAMMSVVGLLAFNFPVVLPVLAKETFHGDGGTYGLLSTMLSVGSIAGSLGVGLIRHPRRIYLVRTAFVFGLAMIAVAVAPGVLSASAALLITGAAAFAFTTLASTTIQLHTAPEYRGRIVALWVFVYIGTTPIGSVLTGWISGWGGPRAALLAGAAACLVAAAAAFRVKTPPHPDAALRDLTPVAR